MTTTQTRRSRTSVLIVDDRPGTFTNNALSRTDIDVVLLRFPAERATSYLERWKHLPAFEVRSDESLENAAARYEVFVDGLTNKPSWFCNPHEPLQAEAQAFAGLVGLPHLTERQVSWVREKPAMKDRYAELGIPHAEYALVQSTADVEEFADRHGWPVIVKPIDSFACIGTYRADSPAQVPELTAGVSWTVERYIRGREFQLCALVTDGQVRAAFLSANPRPVLEVLDGAMNANITYSRGEDHPIDEAALCQQLVDAFGITHGYFHGECFLTEDGDFVMSEIAARISGCEVPENHGRAYGFDIHRAILDSYCNQDPAVSFTRDSAVGDLLLPVSPGRVRHVSDWDVLANLPGVTGGRIKVSVGDILDPPRASMASSGYVHVEGRDVHEVEARMQHVLEAYTIVVK